MATVREDWLAWLPEEKDHLFDTAIEELEVSYVILTVALHDSLTLCQQGKLVPAREGAAMFADLFDRLSARLHGVLRSLDEHGRNLVTLPKVAPLCADFFRGEFAQQVARTNTLMSAVVFRTRARFFRKIEAIEEAIHQLQKEARNITRGIAEGSAVSLPGQWTHLEVLHYDLNTCLRETMIVLKSFFCALPSAEIAPFRKRLLSWLPVTLPVRPRPAASFLSKLVRVGRPQPEGRQAVAAAPHPPAPADRRPRRARENNSRHHKDNSRSKARIPTTRMRPDGTSGPNESN